nr:ribosomal protein S7 [Guinardia delicatula]
MNYNVTKKNFIKPVILNLLMVNGNKNTSEKLLTKSFKLIQKNTKKDFKLILKSSLKSLSPTVSTLRIKKRKTITTVPFFLTKQKRLIHAIKLILSVSSKSSNKPYLLYQELLQSSKNKGNLKSKIKELQSNAFINKNFSNYRWF